MNKLALQCNWTSPGINIEGLNDTDKALIKKFGFEKWLSGNYKIESELRERPILRERPR